MKQIIKIGNTHFNMICNTCGCEFSYDLEDILDNGIVDCPDCNHINLHKLPKIKATKTKKLVVE